MQHPPSRSLHRHQPSAATCTPYQAVTVLSLALALAYAPQAIAQSATAAATQGVSVLTPVIVTADPLSRDVDSLASPVTVLDGDDLIEGRRGTLGELLGSQPGVHADSFGGGASRPVIRGQTAPRVKVLSDGAEVADASAVSPDHVVTVDTLQATKVEILRGPSALLYGGSAIGGVVNVLDDKIPTAIPANGVEGSVEVFGDTASKGRAGAVGLTAGEGNIAVRVQGAKRRADDYRVPDWKDSRVANSHAETSTASVGLSFIGDRGYLGAAYSYREDDYGLPGHSHEFEDCHPHGSSLHCGGHGHDHDHDHEHGHDHADSEHAATAHLRRSRFDVRGELRDPLAGFEALRVRAGYTDYRHDERENGVVGTTFLNRGFDARMELAHKPWNGWKGVVGVQTSRYDFESRGTENFMPKTRTHNTGLFLLEHYTWNDWKLELGARHEWQSVKPQSGAASAFDGGATSLSAGLVWNFAPAYAASLSLSRAQRLPNAQELFARGIHLATNTYEVGDDSLGRETSNTIDLGLRKTLGDARFSINLFHSQVKGYIYGRTLDAQTEGDDVFRLIRYTQQDAQFTGLEAEASYRFTSNVSASVFGDVVRGRLRGGDGNLPRIPSARLGVRANLTWQQWSGFAEYVQVFRQDRVADYEQETAGYGMVGAGVAYHGQLGATQYQMYLRGSNLLNKLAYNHTSFVSRAAPIQGRSIQAGVRVTF